MELCYLVTRSGLTRPDASSMVSPAFCSVLFYFLGIWYEAFYLHFLCSSICSPVFFFPKLGLYSFFVALLVIHKWMSRTVKHKYFKVSEHLLLLEIVDVQCEAVVWNIPGERVRRQQCGTA